MRREHIYYVPKLPSWRKYIFVVTYLEIVLGLAKLIESGVVFLVRYFSEWRNVVACTLYSCSLSATLDIISIYALPTCITALGNTSLVVHIQYVIRITSLRELRHITKDLNNICTMLDQRWRRWPALYKCYINVLCLRGQHGGGPGVVVKAACLESQGSRVRTTLWPSNSKETKCFLPAHS